MAATKNLKIYINGETLDLYPDQASPVATNFILEDRDNFQEKASGTAQAVEVPATRKNSRLLNALHDPDANDVTGVFSNPMDSAVEANGVEILNGPALAVKATHTDSPQKYTLNLLGDNGDWLTQLKDVTLYDVLKDKSYVYNRAVVEASWAFDGTDPNLWYVFAPVRYARPMASAPVNLVSTKPQILYDFNMTVDYMRPMISIYFLLYWAFKSIGYRLTGNFLDTPYFRRLGLLWTWGNYLYSSSTDREKLLFQAKGIDSYSDSDRDFNGFVNLLVSNDSSDGMFDNGSVAGSPGYYVYDNAAFEGKYTYPAGSILGPVNASFHMAVSYDAKVSGNSVVAPAFVGLTIYWYVTHNGVKTNVKQEKIFGLSTGNVGQKKAAGYFETDFVTDMSPGDTISFKIFEQMNVSRLSSALVNAFMEVFRLDFVQLVQGSTVKFSDYTNLQNYKITDLIAGTADLFNWSIKGDPKKKVVLMEPTHPYGLGTNQAAKVNGYFTSIVDDWTEKQDLSKENEIPRFSDGKREQFLSFKPDDADGISKKVSERSGVTLGAGKLILPPRFQNGRDEVTNRFFSATMHYEATQWASITGTPSQLPCLVPENIANTSASEAESTFQPKIAFYKGRDNSQGWVFENLRAPGMPYAFAVNYRPGGETDPVLSYCNEKIGNEASGYQIGIGLLQRFFWQRFATMRHGIYYDPAFFRLNNTIMSDVYQRNLKKIKGNAWELVEVVNYDPTSEDSTEAHLRQSHEPGQEEAANTFPSQSSVLSGTLTSNNFDSKYNPLKGLTSDIK